MRLITLCFDDGFEKSCLRIAEIYEKFDLSASLNVIATGHLPNFTIDDYQKGIKKGDFGLWNELQARGHEIMPHGYKHANKQNLPFSEAKDLILRCLQVFSKELKGFDPRHAVFNFPYNASTPELEAWLPSVVRAFRGGHTGSHINPLPHPGLKRLTIRGFGPGNAEADLDYYIESFLSKSSEGWFLYNLHGLDDEGWGPVRAEYLERLLDRLSRIDNLKLIPPAMALKQTDENSAL